jgi:excinuclease ABC subunit B
MDYEQAARLRDQAVKLRARIEGTDEDAALDRLRKSARKSVPRHGRGKR